MYGMGREEKDAVRKVIDSGLLFRYGDPKAGHLQETARFEQAYAAKIGVPHCLAVTSGTAALCTGLAALGVGPEDEVIVPAYTFMATPLAPLAVGAVPVIAEIDETLTIAPADVERLVTRRTKAIIPVNMCGIACDMGAIMGIARKHKLLVVEDACQAIGGRWHGKRLGSIGDAGAFSFNYFKIISCGEGGAVTLKKRGHYERAQMYADGGCAFRPHAKSFTTPFFAGMNFRVNEILSAVLNAQLGRLDGLLSRMNGSKQALVKALKGHPVCPPARINDLGGDCGTTLVLQLSSGDAAARFVTELRAEGFGSGRPIDSGRHVYSNWEPIVEKRGGHVPSRDPYRTTAAGRAIRYSKDMCPRTLDILARSVSLGVSPKWTRKDVEKLVRAIDRAGSRVRAAAQ